MSALVLSSSVSIASARRVWCDLLIGPVAIAFVLLLSLLVPVRANAQTNMTLQQLVPNLIRNISQTVSASPSGLTVLQAGEVDIGVGAMNTGTGIIGRVMINEARAVSLASIASRVVGYATPIALAMLAADLIQYGIQQCATATTGWCGPQQSPSAGDSGFNGYVWGWPSGATGDSPIAAARAALGSANTYTLGASCGATCYYVNVKHPDGTIATGVSSQQGACVSGYVASGSTCSPSPTAPQVAYTYPQLQSGLQQALSGNPNRSKDYWGIMPPSDWYAALGDPSTSAQPAQIVSPSNGQVVGPKTTTTTSAGTTTTQQTVTVAPNTDTNTLATNPVVVTTTTTTTNPDGTTTTTTTTQNPTEGGSQGGTNPQPQPASSPTPCGLGTSGSPKCQIDETGTPTDGATAMSKSATDLQTAEQTAEAQLSGVNNNRSWTLTMPHILPGGTCQPIEWFSWGSWRGSWDVCTQLQYVRDLLAWLWPVLSAVYVWNKAAGANAGVV